MVSISQFEAPSRVEQVFLDVGVRRGADAEQPELGDARGRLAIRPFERRTRRPALGL
jgi:hypothetical protein